MISERPDYQHIFNDLKCCVIIPTYNNPATLERVVNGVLQYTGNIIIVNDGSDERTANILAQYTTLDIIHLPVNKGKGNALRRGFKHAENSGYRYAVTIDSDGQHFPDDLPVFINTLQHSSADILLIGSRNMTQLGVPRKSSFGNAFSNFWFWFETGIKLTDTQSGFRLYPLHKLPSRLYTNKFEFEIEVIVRAAWNGTQVINVPIKVLYDHNERVSHFRPFTDFTRISILNTILVIIAIFYIKPRDFFRRIKKKGLRKFFLEIVASDDSNLTKSLSVALGVFIGIAPFWGFQTMIVIFLAWILKLNKVISFAFSNISFPPFIPLIIYASLKIGGLFIAEDPAVVTSYDNFDSIRQNLIQYIVGSFIFAAVMAVLFGITAYIALSSINRLKNNANA